MHRWPSRTAPAFEFFTLFGCEFAAWTTLFVTRVRSFCSAIVLVFFTDSKARPMRKHRAVRNGLAPSVRHIRGPWNAPTHRLPSTWRALDRHDGLLPQHDRQPA